LSESGEEKDLSLVRDDIDFNRTIIVDDHDQLPNDQKKNLLKLYEGLGDHNYHNREEAFRVNNNLIRALGLILKTLGQYEAEGESMRDMLYHLQWTSDGEYLDEELNSEDIYSLGLEAMKEINPAIKLIGKPYKERRK
jgi:hypothetical protein